MAPAERDPLPRLRDLRWPIVGAFVGSLVAGLLLGRGVINAVLMALGLGTAGVASLVLSTRRPSARTTGTGVLGVCFGLFLFSLSLDRGIAFAVVTGVGGTAVSLAAARLLRGRVRG